MNVMWPILAILGLGFFTIGTVVGSFLNVCIYRIPWQKSVVWPSSRCPHCFAEIAARDNVPIVSWIALRGECRGCGTSISVRYLLVETLVGFLFLGAYLLDVFPWDRGIWGQTRRPFNCWPPPTTPCFWHSWSRPRSSITTGGRYPNRSPIRGWSWGSCWVRFGRGFVQGRRRHRRISRDFGWASWVYWSGPHSLRASARAPDSFFDERRWASVTSP